MLEVNFQSLGMVLAYLVTKATRPQGCKAVLALGATRELTDLISNHLPLKAPACGLIILLTNRVVLKVTNV